MSYTKTVVLLVVRKDYETDRGSSKSLVSFRLLGFKPLHPSLPFFRKCSSVEINKENIRECPCCNNSSDILLVHGLLASRSLSGWISGHSLRHFVGDGCVTILGFSV